MGWTVIAMAEHYGESTATTLDDPPWLEDCGKNGWIALSKDVSMIRKQPGGALTPQQAVIEAGQVRVFMLMSQTLTAAEQIERFRQHDRAIQNILQSRTGPFVYGIFSDGMREVWPNQSQTTHRPQVRRR
jgi:hypothetical protein